MNTDARALLLPPAIVTIRVAGVVQAAQLQEKAFGIGVRARLTHHTVGFQNATEALALEGHAVIQIQDLLSPHFATCGLQNRGNKRPKYVLE